MKALVVWDPGLRLGRDLGGLQARFWARLNGCDEVLELAQKRQ